VPSPTVPEQLRQLPFTLAQARSAGLTRGALRSPWWRRLFRGVWVHADVPESLELRLSALRLVLPADAVVCGPTAAWLYGADIRRDGDLDVHVYVPPGTRIRSRAGLLVSQAQLADADVWVTRQVTVTSAVRTVFDCLRLRDEDDAIVAADALTHLRCTTVDAVAAYIASRPSLRHCRTAKERLALVEPKTESPMETRLRLLLLRAGLPRPQPQWEVFRGRTFVARLDFAWPAVQVAVEYDGADHWARRREDDRRRAAARELEWHVDVVSSDDYYQTPDDVVAMVTRALQRRGLCWT